MDLKGKRVFITGAANGIGRGLTLEFIRRGATVAALDMNVAALEALKKETALLGAEVVTRVADVSDSGAFTAVLEDLADGGTPDVFVNNAGIAKAGPALDAGVAGFEKILKVNLNGTVTGTLFALRHMRAKDSGVIVNMASLAGIMPAPFLTSYATAKYGVVGLTRSLREELARDGSKVRLCLVCPGFIKTAIIQQDGFALPEFILNNIPTPEQAAVKIVDAVRWGCDEVTPDAGGKVARFFNRLMPDVMTRAARLLPDPRKK